MRLLRPADRELLIAARVTEVARRRAIVGAAFPRIAAAWVEQEEYAAIARRDGREVASAVTRAPHYLLAYLGDTAAYEDAWWGGSGTGRYATWMDYLNAQI
jgi:predicted Zn-dependent protease